MANSIHPLQYDVLALAFDHGCKVYVFDDYDGKYFEVETLEDAAYETRQASYIQIKVEHPDEDKPGIAGITPFEDDPWQDWICNGTWLDRALNARV